MYETAATISSTPKIGTVTHFWSGTKATKIITTPKAKYSAPRSQPASKHCTEVFRRPDRQCGMRRDVLPMDLPRCPGMSCCTLHMHILHVARCMVYVYIAHISGASAGRHNIGGDRNGCRQKGWAASQRCSSQINALAVEEAASRGHHARVTMPPGIPYGAGYHAA